jgi:predicted nuclease of predicted toxin-antitoxin system
MKKINEMEWNDTKVRKKRLANRSKRILNWNHADKNEKILITSSKDFLKNERKYLPNE